jgi:preprotein translocase subunit SecE
VAAIVQELFRFGFYKRTQGRIARQATFGAFALIVALGAWSLSNYLGGFASDHQDWTDTQRNLVQYLIPLAVLAVGLWASFRIVQIPTFAEFLISVENEMNKVSWPSRGELFRASLVVILVIFFLAGILFVYDAILKIVLDGVDSVVQRVFGGA